MVGKGINKVILVGHLGQEPEIRYMSNGNPVTNITIATTENWRDKKTGESREKTEWHRIVIFGKLAEIAGEYLHKGSQVYIEGFLQTRKWQDQSGHDKYTTEIIVGINGNMQMLGNRQNNINNNKTNNQKNTWWDNQNQQESQHLAKNKTIDLHDPDQQSIKDTAIIDNNDTDTVEFDEDIPF